MGCMNSHFHRTVGHTCSLVPMAKPHKNIPAKELVRGLLWLSWRWVWSQWIISGQMEWYFTNLYNNIIFHEIGEFPFLSYLLGWGRVKSLWFDQIRFGIIMNSTTDVENLWHVLAIVSQNFVNPFHFGKSVLRLTYQGIHSDQQDHLKIHTNIMKSCSIQKRWQLSTFYVSIKSHRVPYHLQPLRHGRDSLLAGIAIKNKLFQNRSSQDCPVFQSISCHVWQDNQTCHERAAVALVASAGPLWTWLENTGLQLPEAGHVTTRMTSHF